MRDYLTIGPSPANQENAVTLREMLALAQDELPPEAMDAQVVFSDYTRGDFHVAGITLWKPEDGNLYLEVTAGREVAAHGIGQAQYEVASASK